MDLLEKYSGTSITSTEKGTLKNNIITPPHLMKLISYLGGDNRFCEYGGNAYRKYEVEYEIC